MLKWRLATSEESLVPLLINCWPTQEAGGFTVNVEYELQQSQVPPPLTLALTLTLTLTQVAPP